MDGNIRCLLLNFSVNIELPYEHYEQPIDLKKIHNKLGIVNTSIWEAENADSCKFETNVGKSEDPSKTSAQQYSADMGGGGFPFTSPKLPLSPNHSTPSLNIRLFSSSVVMHYLAKTYPTIFPFSSLAM